VITFTGFNERCMNAVLIICRFMFHNVCWRLTDLSICCTMVQTSALIHAWMTSCTFWSIPYFYLSTSRLPLCSLNGSVVYFNLDWCSVFMEICRVYKTATVYLVKWNKALWSDYNLKMLSVYVCLTMAWRWTDGMHVWFCDVAMHLLLICYCFADWHCVVSHIYLVLVKQ